MYSNRIDVFPKCVLRSFFVVTTLSNDSTTHDEEKRFGRIRSWPNGSTIPAFAKRGSGKPQNSWCSGVHSSRMQV
jgi:hypothetical protein